jgi:hypothetical protein
MQDGLKRQSALSRRAQSMQSVFDKQLQCKCSLSLLDTQNNYKQAVPMQHEVIGPGRNLAVPAQLDNGLHMDVPATVYEVQRAHCSSLLTGLPCHAPSNPCYWLLPSPAPKTFLLTA